MKPRLVDSATSNVVAADLCSPDLSRTATVIDHVPGDVGAKRTMNLSSQNAGRTSDSPLGPVNVASIAISSGSKGLEYVAPGSTVNSTRSNALIAASGARRWTTISPARAGRVAEAIVVMMMTRW